MDGGGDRDRNEGMETHRQEGKARRAKVKVL